MFLRSATFIMLRAKKCLVGAKMTVPKLTKTWTCLSVVDPSNRVLSYRATFDMIIMMVEC